MGHIYLAAFAVGVFYACAGWDKMFLATRRHEMKLTMARLFPRISFIMFVFVSVVELLCGFGLIIWPLLGMVFFTKLCALFLWVVSVTAMIIDGYQRMMDTWKPTTPIDWTSCVLYCPEVLLAILCSIVLLS